MKPFLAAILVSLATVAVSSQRLDMIRTKVEAHDHLAAMVELKQVESSDPEAFHSNNLDYLTARMQLRAGDLGRAAGYFQSVRSRNSILREYATWHLAAIAREQGNLFGERLLLLELLGDRPGSLLAHAVQQRIAQSYFETKNFDEAIAAVTAMIGQGAEKERRELELLLAKALLFIGDAATARTKFESIIATTANPAQPDDLSLDAVKALDLIEVGSEKFGNETASLSDQEHLNRATVYQFNRDFANARLHFQAIVNDHPTSDLTPDAIYQIGRGYSQTANFSEAATAPT